jgi:hypothetical protein
MIIDAQSKDKVIQYLFYLEKDRISKIMNANNELVLYKKGDQIILWNNEYSGSLWFDLDTNDVLENQINELKTFDKIGINDLSLKQFHNLILLMCKELSDDYGNPYICIDKTEIKSE